MPKGIYPRGPEWGKWSKNRTDLGGPSDPRWKRVENVCTICKKKYWIKKSHAELRKTCSRECHKKYRSIYLSRENAPSWKGGISRMAKYHGGFTDEVRRLVKERDGQKCTGCGSSNNLQVHHVNFKRTDNRMKNLVTLCASCHVTVEKLRWWKTKMREKKY